jgi:hypothetical protein
MFTNGFQPMKSERCGMLSLLENEKKKEHVVKLQYLRLSETLYLCRLGIDIF